MERRQRARRGLSIWAGSVDPSSRELAEREFLFSYFIGLPYLFSLLLSNDLAQVISRYLYGISICVVIFCVLHYYLASRLYGSRFWGIVFTLLTMALLANALFWAEPSSAPIRFLLFPVCAIAILKMGLTDIKSIIVLSVLCALSILNNTETGVLTGMATGTVLLMISTSFLQLSKRLCLLLVGTGLCTGILCLICYGWSALSWSFILGNLKPLFAYAICRVR